MRAEAGALLAELADLRRQRETLRGRPGRRAMDELRRLTRRELTIEATLLPRASAAPAEREQVEPRRPYWWQQ